jgi:hypothetical protein
MRRAVAVGMALVLVCGVQPAAADVIGEDGQTTGGAETVADAVRVTLIKMGGSHVVQGISGPTGAGREGCTWTVLFAPDLDDSPYGTSAGPQPHPEARFALLLCDGSIVRAIWVAPDDVVDLDALARDEAQRYIEDVLVPSVTVGANPAGQGLVGLSSWFWVEGFAGSVTAPPISAFGLTIDVRLGSGSVTWDFGDGTRRQGDLGQAYPERSSVRHTHQRHGSYEVVAEIDLVPEYRVDGGPWLALPGLQVVASVTHPVEQRQAVITNA